MAERSDRAGRHWVIAAVGLLIVPALVAMTMAGQPAYQRCERLYGAERVSEIPACRNAVLAYGFPVLAFWAVALVSTVVGLCVGIVEGRRRRRFAHGRWVAMVVVGLCAPWALAAYAIGYGLGRAMPRARPSVLDRLAEERQRGWREATDLYGWLAGGNPPPVVPAPPFLGAEPVHLSTGFLFARFHSADVTYSTGSVLAVGSRAYVTGAMVGNLIGNVAARSRAANQARAQWRGNTAVSVVLTPTATWCRVEGRWLQFHHAGVVEYLVDTAGPACVLTFVDANPLRLTGPYAWCHAVLFAYFRHGPQAWRDAPYLRPLRDAALAP
jgi:hypothetical protein